MLHIARTIDLLKTGLKEMSKAKLARKNPETVCAKTYNHRTNNRVVVFMSCKEQSKDRIRRI